MGGYIGRVELVLRRLAAVKVALPLRSTDDPIHLVVDSTGLKVYGEGE